MHRRTFCKKGSNAFPFRSLCCCMRRDSIFICEIQSESFVHSCWCIQFFSLHIHGRPPACRRVEMMMMGWQTRGEEQPTASSRIDVDRVKMQKSSSFVACRAAFRSHPSRKCISVIVQFYANAASRFRPSTTTSLPCCRVALCSAVTPWVMYF